MQRAGDNIRVPIAVLFTLIVLLGVANGLVRNGRDFGHWCGQYHHFLPKGIPPFGVQRKVTGTEMHFPGSVITHYDTFIPMGCKV